MVVVAVFACAGVEPSKVPAPEVVPAADVAPLPTPELRGDAAVHPLPEGYAVLGLAWRDGWRLFAKDDRERVGTFALGDLASPLLAPKPFDGWGARVLADGTVYGTDKGRVVVLVPDGTAKTLGAELAEGWNVAALGSIEPLRGLASAFAYETVPMTPDEIKAARTPPPGFPAELFDTDGRTTKVVSTTLSAAPLGGSPVELARYVPGELDVVVIGAAATAKQSAIAWWDRRAERPVAVRVFDEQGRAGEVISVPLPEGVGAQGALHLDDAGVLRLATPRGGEGGRTAIVRFDGGEMLFPDVRGMLGATELAMTSCGGVSWLAANEYDWTTNRASLVALAFDGERVGPRVELVAATPNTVVSTVSTSRVSGPVWLACHDGEVAWAAHLPEGDGSVLLATGTFAVAAGR